MITMINENVVHFLLEILRMENIKYHYLYFILNTLYKIWHQYLFCSGIRPEEIPVLSISIFYWKHFAWNVNIINAYISFKINWMKYQFYQCLYSIRNTFLEMSIISIFIFHSKYSKLNSNNTIAIFLWKYPVWNTKKYYYYINIEFILEMFAMAR